MKRICGLAKVKPVTGHGMRATLATIATSSGAVSHIVSATLMPTNDRVGLFHYHSVSDSGAVSLHIAGQCTLLRLWFWDNDRRVLKGTDDGLIELWETLLLEVVEAEQSPSEQPDADGTYFVYEYWTHLFPEVPIRHGHSEEAWSRSEDMVEHLEFVIAHETRSSELWYRLGYHT